MMTFMPEQSSPFPVIQFAKLIDFMRDMMPTMLARAAFDAAAQTRLSYALSRVSIALEEYERSASQDAIAWIRLHCGTLTRELAPALVYLPEEVQLRYREVLSSFVSGPNASSN